MYEGPLTSGLSQLKYSKQRSNVNGLLPKTEPVQSRHHIGKLQRNQREI